MLEAIKWLKSIAANAWLRASSDANDIKVNEFLWFINHLCVLNDE